MLPQIIYYSPISRRTVCVDIDQTAAAADGIDGLYDQISEIEAISPNDFQLYTNGRRLTTWNQLVVVANDSLASTPTPTTTTTLTLHVGLRGGKGGFGSMLRAIGAQIEKTTNREACRDLSGRRLRDVNEEKRIKEWIKREAQRKQESDDRRRQRLERMAETPKTEYNDTEFERIREEIPNAVSDALEYGLKVRQQRQQQEQSASSSSSSTATSAAAACSSSSSTGGDIDGAAATAGSSGEQLKRKANDSHNIKSKAKNKKKNKKKKKTDLWLGVDDIDTDDDDSNDDAVSDDVVAATTKQLTTET